jgi:hypothetical protein
MNWRIAIERENTSGSHLNGSNFLLSLHRSPFKEDGAARKDYINIRRREKKKKKE